MIRSVEIISTAHWAGDPRLNRHVRYLTDGGHRAWLTTFADHSRNVALRRSLAAIVRSNADIVMIPDPELFLLGSLAARLSGKLPVIDIHEDYAKAAMARSWIPDASRPFVRIAAALAVRAGRLAAWRVLVAAPELARSGDRVALNIPDPSTLAFTSHDGSKRLVYVGDLTVERGALTMIELIAEMSDDFELRLVGGASDEISQQLRAKAEQLGVTERVEFTGRLSHEEAWNAARGSLAGLNLLQPVPAYRDAVATKLWEYLVTGLPPIVSDLPGHRRLIARLDVSLVCTSVREAAGIAKSLSMDPARRTLLGQHARELVEAEWSQRRPDEVVRSVVSP